MKKIQLKAFFILLIIIGNLQNSNAQCSLPGAVTWNSIPTPVYEYTTQTYSVVQEIKTFTDWYLPSIGDLDLMWAELKNYGVGGFANQYYWSSNQWGANDARTINFNGNTLSYDPKTTLHRVRACRDFTTTLNLNVRDIGPAGGYVFRKVNNGDGTYTYYEAAPSDQSTSAEWGCSGTSITLSAAAGAGQANTTAIIAACSTSGIAAKICDNASITSSPYYFWAVPAGWTILSGQGTDTITVKVGPHASSVSVDVTPTNPCSNGVGAVNSVAIDVYSQCGVPTISTWSAGVSTACEASIQVFSVNQQSKSFTDWYLPSEGDLSLMWTQLKNYSLGGFANQYYWSSSQYGANYARTIDFSDNTLSLNPRTNLHRVRACRDFTTTEIFNVRDIGPAGGYIFRKVNNGDGTYTYYEAAPSDQSTGAEWGCSGTSIVLSVLSGEGQANTTAIIAACATSGIAARVCNSYSLSVNPTYTWTVPATGYWNILSGQGTNSVSINIGDASGTVSVVPSYPCGSASASNYTVTVNPVSDSPGPISGSIAPCPGSSQVYSIAVAANTTNYAWTVPTGWNITSGQNSNSITATVGSTGQNGSINVTTSNGCGSGGGSGVSVTVARQSTIPTSISITNNNTCIGTEKQLSPVGGSLGTGASYQWYSTSCGGTLLGTGSSLSLYPLSGNTDYYLRISGTCNTTACVIGTVTTLETPATPGVISGSTTICQNSTNTFSISPVINATSYVWTIPAGWSINSGQSSTSLNITSSTLGGTISVYSTLGSCSSSTRSSSIQVIATVPGSLSNVSANACYGASHKPIVLSGNSGNVINWETGTSAGGPWTSIIKTDTFYSADNLSQNLWIKANIRNGSCTTLSTSPVQIGVLSNPVANGISDGAIEGMSCDFGSTSAYISLVDSNNKFVASVKDPEGGTVIHEVRAKSIINKVNGVPTAYPHQNSGVYCLPRHFTITPFPSTNVSGFVRLYFTDAELQSLIDSNSSVVSIADLAVTKFSDGTSSVGTYLEPVAYGLNSPSIGIHYIEVSVTSFSDFYIHGHNSEDSPLPINLISFDAFQKSNSIDIIWKTSSETNNDYFTIEKSIDGVNYSRLCVVDGAGNSNTLLSYTYNDISPVSGNNYYRMFQTDYDGKTYKKSEVVVNYKPVENKPIIFTKENNHLYIYYSYEEDFDFSLKVVDMSGKIVLKEQLNSTNQLNVDFDLSNLSSGIYLISANFGNFVTNKKIIIP